MDWILYLAALFLVMFSQIKVQGAYARYRQVMTLRGYTGAQVARRILDDHGLQHVQVEPSPGGALSDHYDPKANVVRLSEDIYANSSIASVAVAAHECGHAIQHAENYGFIALRNSILPFAMVSSQLSWLVLILGLLFSSTGLFYTGILMLSCVAVFQLVTLPVELDASKRAMALVYEEGFVVQEERKDVKAMLSAAAFTYRLVNFLSAADPAAASDLQPESGLDSILQRCSQL